jgi:hypothetical protein
MKTHTILLHQERTLNCFSNYRKVNCYSTIYKLEFILSINSITLLQPFIKYFSRSDWIIGFKIIIHTCFKTLFFIPNHNSCSNGNYRNILCILKLSDFIGSFITILASVCPSKSHLAFLAINLNCFITVLRFKIVQLEIILLIRVLAKSILILLSSTNNTLISVKIFSHPLCCLDVWVDGVLAFFFRIRLFNFYNKVEITSVTIFADELYLLSMPTTGLKWIVPIPYHQIFYS